eukprot:TRINITY_DN14558_c0_g1_i1.p1 TRINITY_DN14558_c0_g1~~TRINITY_DN14558_c0_g1_i1.p1  ORF type:complete len:247 (-),score=23.84 TRINITY_DN14558_c0_g1_i1:194-877(-)
MELDDIAFEVFCQCAASTLSRCARVCSRWRRIVHSCAPAWRRLCVQVGARVDATYPASWRDMFRFYCAQQWLVGGWQRARYPDEVSQWQRSKFDRLTFTTGRVGWGKDGPVLEEAAKQLLRHWSGPHALGILSFGPRQTCAVVRVAEADVLLLYPVGKMWDFAGVKVYHRAGDRRQVSPDVVTRAMLEKVFEGLQADRVMKVTRLTLSLSARKDRLEKAMATTYFGV